MNAFRLKKDKQDITNKMQAWDKLHPYTVDHFYPKAKQYSHQNEEKLSYKQKKISDKSKYFRQEGSLNAVPNDVNLVKEEPNNKQIPLTYNENPKVTTMSKLLNQRYEQKSKDVEILAHKKSKGKDGDQRVIEKEN